MEFKELIKVLLGAKSSTGRVLGVACGDIFLLEPEGRMEADA